MNLPETFQITTILEKLSPAWRDFKNYLKHKCNELKLEDLIMRLRIEEDNRKSEKRSNKNSMKSRCDRRLKGESIYFQRLEAEKHCPGVQRQGPRRKEQALQGNLLYMQQRGTQSK